MTFQTCNCSGSTLSRLITFHFKIPGFYQIRIIGTYTFFIPHIRSIYLIFCPVCFPDTYLLYVTGEPFVTVSIIVHHTESGHFNLIGYGLFIDIRSPGLTHTNDFTLSRTINHGIALHICRSIKSRQSLIPEEECIMRPTIFGPVVRLFPSRFPFLWICVIIILPVSNHCSQQSLCTILGTPSAPMRIVCHGRKESTVVFSLLIAIFFDIHPKFNRKCLIVILSKLHIILTITKVYIGTGISIYKQIPGNLTVIRPCRIFNFFYFLIGSSNSLIINLLRHICDGTGFDSFSQTFQVFSCTLQNRLIFYRILSLMISPLRFIINDCKYFIRLCQ